MKNFKENTSKLQKLNDWLNAYEIEGCRGHWVALLRHSLVLILFAVCMFLVAVGVLGSSGV